MADQPYWVRTEQGRVWGPYTLGALQRMRGNFTVNCEVSLDNKTFQPGPRFDELKDLLAPARKVERQVVPDAAPRVSAALKQALGIADGPAPAAAAEAPAPAPVSAPAPAPAPSPPPAAEQPLEVPASGDLAETSPARLFAVAAQTNASGRLQFELEKGRMLQISFRRGTPEHLSSDDPELSLLHLLKSRGTISATQAMAAEELAAAGGRDLVSVLFELQLVPPAEAHALLQGHALFLLDRALMTWRGRFTFEKDAPSPPGAFSLGQKWALLAEGMRRTDAAALRARLGKRLARPVVRSGGLAIGRIEELAFNAQEARVYASIDGTRTGEEVLQAQPDSASAARIFYLLTELGHLAFVDMEAQAPPPPPPPRSAPPPPAAKPVAKEASRELPKIARDGGREPAQPASVPQPKPSQAPPVLQGQRPPGPAGASAPPAKAPPPMGPSPVFAVPPPDETPQAQLRRLQGLLEKLSVVDHFEALGMSRKSPGSPAEAKRNFFVLARELHPDTIAEPGPLRDMKERLFARINEAAQVLTDEKKRKEYEEELEGKANNVDVKRIFAAEEDFQRAEIMIKARKYQEGLELLERAIELNDGEAEFYAWRGYARFLASKDRKGIYDEAADDLKKAIKMVERCVPAHLFLGHISKVVGETKLAQKCYERVLQLDPKHIEATRELRMMGKKG